MSFYRLVSGISSFHVDLLVQMKNVLQVFVKIPTRTIFFCNLIEVELLFSASNLNLFSRTHLLGNTRLFFRFATVLIRN